MEFVIKGKDKDLVCLIDKEDYDRIKEYNWRVVKIGESYYVFKKNGRKSIFLHRFLLGIWQSENRIKVDHINKNGLDNRKENLRIVPFEYNLFSKKGWGKSELVGVSFCKSMNKFSSCIHKGKDRYFLGYFDTERLAGIAYDIKAKELYGGLALTNKIICTKEERDFVRSYKFRKDNNNLKLNLMSSCS